MDLCPGTMEATAEGKGKVYVKTKQRDDIKVHGYISMYSNLDPREDWPQNTEALECDHWNVFFNKVNSSL